MSVSGEQVMRWVGFIPRLIVAMVLVVVVGGLGLFLSLFIPTAIEHVRDLYKSLKQFVVTGNDGKSDSDW